MTIDQIARRFHGVDIQYRRDGWCEQKRSAGWGDPHLSWRARLLTSKNEAAEYRLSAYGETEHVAVALLLDAVAAIDASRPASR